MENNYTKENIIKNIFSLNYFINMLFYIDINKVMFIRIYKV